MAYLTRQTLGNRFLAYYPEGENWCLAELVRLWGRVLQLAGATTNEIEGCYQEALAIAQAQRSRSLELRVALARLWRGQDQREAAHRLLREIYGWFSEGFETADLQAARALLVALSA